MKNIYSSPEINIVKVSNVSVITTSITVVSSSMLGDNDAPIKNYANNSLGFSGYSSNWSIKKAARKGRFFGWSRFFRNKKDGKQSSRPSNHHKTS